MARTKKTAVGTQHAPATNNETLELKRRRLAAATVMRIAALQAKLGKQSRKLPAESRAKIASYLGERHQRLLAVLQGAETPSEFSC
jgi:hypothetical protein